MTSNDKRVGIGGFVAALVTGLNWRALLAWLLLMLLPVVVATSPVRQALGKLLDHSVHAADWASGFHALPMLDVVTRLVRDGNLDAGPSAGFLLTLILMPFLTGMIVAMLRTQRDSTLGDLMHGGLGEYWRMFRLMLWSLVPYGIAIGVGAAAFGMAGKSAEAATLQSVADRGHDIALWLTVVFVVLAHAWMESARAQVAADPDLRSATRAFGRGARMLFGRPLATLGMYLATSIIGYVLVLFVTMWRVHTPAVGGVDTVLAFVIAEILVLVLAWQRIARLAGLTVIARTRVGASRRGYASLATA